MTVPRCREAAAAHAESCLLVLYSSRAGSNILEYEWSWNPTSPTAHIIYATQLALVPGMLQVFFAPCCSALNYHQRQYTKTLYFLCLVVVAY